MHEYQKTKKKQKLNHILNLTNPLNQNLIKLLIRKKKV